MPRDGIRIPSRPVLKLDSSYLPQIARIGQFRTHAPHHYSIAWPTCPA